MSEPTSASYGSMPPGFVCGRCGQPLSTKWVDACQKCGARYIEFTPKATKNTRDPMGDSPAMRRFQTLMYVVVVVAIVVGIGVVSGAGLVFIVPATLIALALGWVHFKRLFQ
jgi:hypothetical protein